MASLSILGALARKHAADIDAALIDEPTREGIPLDEWRALPDSPNTLDPIPRPE